MPVEGGVEGGVVSDRRLSGRVAIVTGSSRGLGRRGALALGRAGATVAVVARTAGPSPAGSVGDTAALIEAAGGRALPLACDVTDPDAVEDMVRTVRDRCGRIDVLVVHAVVQPDGGVSAVQPRHWRRMVDVNLHGAFSCCRAVVPTMLAQGSGSIVTVSVGGEAPPTSRATQRAVEELTVGLAREHATNGIACNVLVAERQLRGSGAEAPAPEPDPYGEAVVRLALQTPSTCTGQVLDHAAVLTGLGWAGADPSA
jgi:citronellol/citronellal dehydrogenase